MGEIEINPKKNSKPQVLVEPRPFTSSSLDSQKRELEEPIPQPTLGAEGQ